MATKLLIDGYNFLWESSVHRKGSLKKLDDARNGLQDWLISHHLPNLFDVYLIFDAHQTEKEFPTQFSERGIEIIFSAQNQKADEILKQMASEWTLGCIVISSDHEVMRHAEKRGAGVLGSREFQVFVEHPESFRWPEGRRFGKGKQKALQKLRKVFFREDD